MSQTPSSSRQSSMQARQESALPPDTRLAGRRVVVSGASGLVGRALVLHLRQAGAVVGCLVRRPAEPGRDEVAWEPATGQIDRARLEGADAVVHLAGENIAAGRWTAARKEAIRTSRVDGTRLLAEALASLARPPRVLVAASAVGFYGHRGDEEVDETSPPGSGYLSDVCQQWEAAALPAAAAGIRVVHLRIGMVLTRAGGALARMLPPFRLGLAGRIGSGRQWMSWIALEDLLAVIERALTRDSLAGPVNAVSPGAVTNAEFTRTLARVLRRPAILPLPGFAVRLLFGEMGRCLLLEGARVRPGKLIADGFPFVYPDLEDALRDELAP